MSTEFVPNSKPIAIVNTNSQWVVGIPAPSGAPPPNNGNVIAAGYYVGSNQSSPITRSGNIATYTLDGHGFKANDWVAIGSASQTQYNILAQIISTTTNTFSYKIAGSPVTPSTGTSQVVFWFSNSRSTNLSKISKISTSGVGQFVFTFTNPQPDNYYGFQASANDGDDDQYVTFITIDSSNIDVFVRLGADLNNANPLAYFYMQLIGIV